MGQNSAMHDLRSLLSWIAAERHVASKDDAIRILDPMHIVVINLPLTNQSIFLVSKDHYGSYISQISFLLFLKMDDERTELIGEPSMLPKGLDQGLAGDRRSRTHMARCSKSSRGRTA